MKSPADPQTTTLSMETCFTLMPSCHQTSLRIISTSSSTLSTLRQIRVVTTLQTTFTDGERIITTPPCRTRSSRTFPTQTPRSEKTSTGRISPLRWMREMGKRSCGSARMCPQTRWMLSKERLGCGARRARCSGRFGALCKVKRK